jgi:hypothetical protein
MSTFKTIAGAGLAASIGLGSLSAAGDQTFGAGVKVTEVTTIAALYQSPQKFLGKTIRVDGVVTAVCEEMGCWMALAAEGKPDQTIRFKVEDGQIVFPTSARGKRASAEGVFERIAKGDAEANEAAQEHAAKQPTSAEFSKTYHVKATGAIVK